ncbi:hypothetical protein [Thermostaphylospora chromogena]|uniref:Tryptophan-associated transmembrane protein (Trp_oprn_chp) n=1 Tax=Thermostaphylospora chromogena TaxID=35622 RepID=A0A1H1GPL9_9ACTN|nr:hypothetical protein [Thermostaphylospora chromogena]SDR15127.1 hypothetical protein SAMN04489764_3729 [Thermostaphylospora chromogena]
MRHVLGFLVGVVVTAVLLFGGGWAVQQATAHAAVPDAVEGARLWIALGAMAGVGLVFGVVAATRISPMAAFVPSMTLLSWTVVYALDMDRALSLIPDDPSMHELLRQAGEGQRVLLTTGVLAMLGVALFVPVLLPSRWVREEPDDDEEEDYDEDDYGAAGPRYG